MNIKSGMILAIIAFSLCKHNSIAAQSEKLIQDHDNKPIPIDVSEIKAKWKALTTKNYRGVEALEEAELNFLVHLHTKLTLTIKHNLPTEEAYQSFAYELCAHKGIANLFITIQQK